MYSVCILIRINTCLNHVLIIFCVFIQTVMSVKRKTSTRRVINLQSPAKRVDIEEEQSQETQETSQRKFDTIHFYNAGEKFPTIFGYVRRSWFPTMIPVPLHNGRQLPTSWGQQKKLTGGPTLTHDKPSLIKDRGAKKQQITGDSRVRKFNSSPTKGLGSKKRATVTDHKIQRSRI